MSSTVESSPGRTSTGTASESRARVGRPVDSTRQLRDQYDWVVIGEEPGALLSACLVARLGLSVLILPTGKELRVRTSRARQIIDFEPNWITGLGHNGLSPGLLRWCLTEIGLHPVDLAMARNEPIDMQLLTPQMRLRMGRAYAEIQDDLEKELGRDFARALQVPHYVESLDRTLGALWSRFPDRFNLKLSEVEGAKPSDSSLTAAVKSKRNQRNQATLSTGALLEKEVTNFCESKDASLWLRFLSQKKPEFLKMNLGEQDFEDLSSILHWIVQGKEANWRSSQEILKSISLQRSSSGFQGGRSALKQTLLRVAQKSGAHTPQGRLCKRIFSDRGKLAGVQMSQSGNVIGAAGLILGVTLDEASGLLSEENRASSALRPSPSCRGWLYSLSIQVPNWAIPPGVTSLMVSGSRNSPPLMIEVSSPHEYGADPTDQRLIFVRSELPYDPETLTADYQRIVAARMIHELNQIFPGIMERSIRVYPDYRSSDSTELLECYPFTTLREIPDALRIFERSAVGGLQSGVEGVFLGTRESLPGLGDFAGVLSAIEASAWIAHKNGIPSLFS